MPSRAEKKALKLQKLWHSEALKDEKYLLKRAKEVKSPVLRALYKREARVARNFALIRAKAIKSHDPSHRIRLSPRQRFRKY